MKVSMFISPLILAMMGVLIRLGKASFLIAGYNTSSKQEREKYDEKVLCKFVGNLLLVIASILLIPALAIALDLNYLKYIAATSTTLILLIAIAAAIYANTGDRFKK